MARNLISKDRRTRILLLTAQGLALAALVLGLIFLVNTTGGTLFLFSALAPVLVGLVSPWWPPRPYPSPGAPALRRPLLSRRPRGPLRSRRRRARISPRATGSSWSRSRAPRGCWD